jgi:hypothetical protein
MNGIAFIKVIMMTGFLFNGTLIQEETETTLDKCSLAKEEAIRFNNRFLWPWNEETRSGNRVFVACFYHSETKEA